HPIAKRVVQARILSQREDSWKGVVSLLDQLDDEETRNLVTDAASDPKKIEDPEKALKGDPSHGDKRGILERLRDEFLDRQLAALQHRANNPETPDSERLELLKQQQELR